MCRLDASQVLNVCRGWRRELLFSQVVPKKNEPSFAEIILPSKATRNQYSSMEEYSAMSEIPSDQYESIPLQSLYTSCIAAFTSGTKLS